MRLPDTHILPPRLYRVHKCERSHPPAHVDTHGNTTEALEGRDENRSPGITISSLMHRAHHTFGGPLRFAVQPVCRRCTARETGSNNARALTRRRVSLREHAGFRRKNANASSSLARGRCHCGALRSQPIVETRISGNVDVTCAFEIAFVLRQSERPRLE